jgi:uncharacterized protein (DUF58 family)
MLLVVLVLVLAALGLLVAALVTSAMLWAWLSVAASVLAAGGLIADWSQRRRARAEEPPPAEVAPEPDEDADPDAEPAEEDTDAADLLIVTDLAVEVRVLDERPRYHLAGCRWLAGRASLPLPVHEARELGFTPCAVCAPDRTLAAAHRTAGAG